MKHEAKIALALSEQGEQLFQSLTVSFPGAAETIAEADQVMSSGIGKRLIFPAILETS